jgi:SAM-dependent methyltransferase
MMVSWARKSGVKLHVEAVDASPSILRIASSMSTRFPEISFTRGDALSFGEMRKYDLVHCSLALHHFSDGDAVRLLRQCRDLSRRYVIVTDLERSCTTRVAVRTANVLLGHGRMTREDGDTSARRAFSFREAHALAERAGWMDFSHGRSSSAGRHCGWTCRHEGIAAGKTRRLGRAPLHRVRWYASCTSSYGRWRPCFLP